MSWFLIWFVTSGCIMWMHEYECYGVKTLKSEFFENHWFVCFNRQLIWLYSNWKIFLGWQLKSQFCSFIFSCAVLCLPQACVVQGSVKNLDSAYAQNWEFPQSASFLCRILASFFQWVVVALTLFFKKTVVFQLESATPGNINLSMP